MRHFLLASGKLHFKYSFRGLSSPSSLGDIPLPLFTPFSVENGHLLLWIQVLSFICSLYVFFLCLFVVMLKWKIVRSRSWKVCPLRNPQESFLINNKSIKKKYKLRKELLRRPFLRILSRANHKFQFSFLSNAGSVLRKF